VQAQLLVKTVTSYHVRVLKFSPFEPDHFVSAGRDSIRCYRMKGDDLRGISIKMQVRLKDYRAVSEWDVSAESCGLNSDSPVGER
jgi:hypothetical protein